MKISVFKAHRHYVWIILLGVLVRVLWAIAVPVVPTSDSYAYDQFAYNLASCHNYGWNCREPSAYWPVGTSFIYSLLYQQFGHYYLPIVVLNILLAACTIGLSMYLAESWFGRRVAVITGLLLAVWPSQIQFTTVLASEQMFTCLIVAGLALWINDRLNLWLQSVLIGIVLAGASYVRPTAFLIPVLLLFLRYISTREILRSLVATLIMFAVMGLLIAPWSIRNTQTFGQFVFISTNDGANLWMGNNPASTGEYMDFPAEAKGLNEAQGNQYLKSVALAHIKQHPLLFATRSAKRVLTTHSRESVGVLWNQLGLTARYGKWVLAPLKLMNQLYWMPMLGLGLIGIGVLINQLGWRGLAHPTVALWGYFTAVHAIIVAQDRYHFPSIPMIAILAALPLAYLLNRSSAQQQDIKSDRSLLPRR